MVDLIRHLLFPEKRPPFVIATLLDDTHDRLVRAIWQELQDELGIQHIFQKPIPHITHVTAGNIERELLEEAMEQFAHLQEPIIIRTAGLGLFTGERKAIYVSVIRNPELTRFQNLLIGTLTGTLEEISEHNLINYWMPHISLLLPGMGDDRLAEVVDLFAQRDFTWEITLNQLTLLTPDNPITVTLKGNDD